MTVAGLILTVIGGALFLIALVRTVRANPDARVPFNRNPQVIPAGTVAMRSVGAGLLVFGAVAMSATFDYWGVLFVLTCPIVALVVILIHNRRIGSVSND